MPALAENARRSAANPVEQAAELLGGQKVLRRRIGTRLQVHDAIQQGLPGAALEHLIGRVVVLKNSELLRSAIGVSIRTAQRRKGAPDKPLSQDQSGRLWKFAEILAKATDVFGSQADAEAWLNRPAMALERRTPIELLATPAGAEMVEDLLTRIEYGIYT